MNKINKIVEEFKKSNLPKFNSGDTIAVDVKVREGNKERIQRFEGVVIGRNGGNSLDGTFTLRKKKERIGRNPKTNEIKQIKERNVILFKASKKFKNLLNDG